MAQRLGALDALLEDLASVVRTHMVARNCLNLQFPDLRKVESEKAVLPSERRHSQKHNTSLSRVLAERQGFSREGAP